MDRADNNSTATSGPINIDKTAPVITFQGVRTYTVDEVVSVTCTATDALSGLISNPCEAPLLSGDAYMVGLGTHSVTVTVTDRAGNTVTQSATITVKVTYDSVCTLTRRWSSKPGVANGLCAKLQAAANSASRRNEKARTHQLDAYLHEFEAQTGKAIFTENARMLASLVNALR